MYETWVTMVGWVAGEITKRRTGDNVPVMSFRLDVHERRYNPETREWIDGERMFVSVHCWRDMGENVATSLRRGDRVIVFGRMYHREYVSGQHQRLSVELDARSIGPDLARCAVSVNREPKAAEPQLALVPAAVAAEEPAVAEQVAA
ncbi:single-stranded DNA-binding protein [Actinokineospora sp. HUAS TT18]|uniref:single-stranded DNA-binding protein n=1 Tax=Actinokineospora sp. HUAS TT18 TaxID=3447451 RepID=UPI003F524984